MSITYRPLEMLQYNYNNKLRLVLSWITPIVLMVWVIVLHNDMQLNFLGLNLPLKFSWLHWGFCMWCWKIHLLTNGETSFCHTTICATSTICRQLGVSFPFPAHLMKFGRRSRRLLIVYISVTTRENPVSSTMERGLKSLKIKTIISTPWLQNRYLFG